ncbi:hypothetical protein AURDEDRAFT_116225 [Auricularia subglabra TFB-10046 SS5]|nr:hypothetical protein AURDEDRAFT_116225 [Auricularia subglabra TFB-10046 SS5]
MTVATDDLLARLKTLYPAAWYVPAAVAFSGGNVPDALPAVFRAAAADLPTDQHALLARRIRDAVFKAGVLTGYNKAINSLLALHEALPENLRADPAKPERPIDTVTIDDIRKHGGEFFEGLYGDTAQGVQGLLDAIYPDMGFMSRVIAYGLVYGGAEHLLSTVETSFVLVAALVAGDTPRQVGWHLANARRIGASKDEAQAVRQIAIECAKAAGVVWKNEIPDVVD